MTSKCYAFPSACYDVSSCFLYDFGACDLVVIAEVSCLSCLGGKLGKVGTQEVTLSHLPNFQSPFKQCTTMLLLLACIPALLLLSRSASLPYAVPVLAGERARSRLTDC